MIGQETPFSLGLTCTALPDSSDLAIAGQAAFAINQPATLSANLLDLSDMRNPIVGETVTFQLRGTTGTTDADGEASCTIPSRDRQAGTRATRRWIRRRLELPAFE